MSAAKATEPTRLRDLYATRKDLGGWIDPKLIKIMKGFNVRDYRLPENRAHLDSLKKQIKEYGGVYRALLVRYDGGQAILVDGESRLTAVLELIQEGTPIEAVPVQSVTTKDEAELLTLSVGANGGKSLSVWELGIAYKRFDKMGWDKEKIASTFGVSLKHVENAIEAAELPQDAKKLLSERAVSPQLALEVFRKGRGKQTSEESTKELAGKAAAHKAKGKKGPAKATKAPSKKVNDWETIARKLYKEVEPALLEMETGEKYDFLEVSVAALKRLGKLVNGIK